MVEEIIEILNEIDSDNSRFLKNVLNAYCLFTKERNVKIKNTQIYISDTKTDIENGIINLDEINAEKYFYTKMKLKQNNIVELLLNTKKEDLKNDKILRRIIYNKQKSQMIENNNRDLVNVIQELNERGITKLKFVANSIDDINLFKEEQLKIAMEIIKTDEKDRYGKIYEYVCNYLKKDFISNNYCDFIHNKCIA